MFLLLSIIEKSPAKCRGQEIPVVPPQFIPARGPHGILADPQAVSGPTRPPLLKFRQTAPKGIPFPGPHCLAPSGSSLAEPLEMYWFSSTRYRYVLLSLPLSLSQVNIQIWKNIQNSVDFPVYIVGISWTFVFVRKISWKYCSIFSLWYNAIHAAEWILCLSIHFLIHIYGFHRKPSYHK